MTLHIDFTPQFSERITQVAQSRGIDPITLLETMVAEHLPPLESTEISLSFPSPGRAAERLRARLDAEATDDQEIVRNAQDTLNEMKRSMNAERLRSGAEPIF